MSLRPAQRRTDDNRPVRGQSMAASGSAIIAHLRCEIISWPTFTCRRDETLACTIDLQLGLARDMIDQLVTTLQSAVDEVALPFRVGNSRR